MQGLDSITIQGFKSISSIEKLPLERVNVVIGANGSGKSNFIEAFAFLNAIREERLEAYGKNAGFADRLLHFGEKSTRFLNLGFQSGKLSYRLTLRPSEVGQLLPEGETTCLNGITDPLEPQAGGREAGISGSHSLESWIKSALWRCWVYHLDDTDSSSPIRKTARVEDGRPLRPDGSNLPAFLYNLHENFRENLDSIVREVRRVAPFFLSFSLEPDGKQAEFISLNWNHRRSNYPLGVSSLSDGTLRFIMLATLLLQPQGYLPSVILIDEPELGLHPYAMAILAALVREASRSTQIILCTQSPTLLDYFEPKEVLVADLVNDATTLRRLEPEPFKEWLEDYSLGQLWEKNEFGDQPVPA